MFLGIIQGLTEFLPISSSGHLVLAEHYLNFKSPNISFEIVLHLGSLLAVLIFFRKDIFSLIRSLIVFKSTEEADFHNRKTLLYLLIATLVTALLGLAFEDLLTKAFSALYIPSLMLLLTGTILFISDRVESSGLLQYQIGIKKSVIIGLSQAVAILPGISRSGTTISVGLFCGLSREDAARFSFLLSIPAILGANIHKFNAIMELEKAMWLSYFLGASCAFLSGYAVIAVLISFVKKQKLKYFAYYCWVISLITLILYFR
ncbi:MAG: undecaprenyl-diphosphate phosphatase [Candidatus Cloacimonetes bacterium]|nr:undecaprenyl-diphosphate phosphatase [Candidatus Cloacimonadota bacterium]